jgi:hypothetical protein
MLKTALGILTGILIFIAAGLLATYWIGKMRRDMEDKRPRLAHRSLGKTPYRGPRLARCEPIADRLARIRMELTWTKRYL